MQSLFIFRNDGTFLDEIREGFDISTHSILKGVEVNQPLLLREKMEETPTGTRYVMYLEPESPDSPRYIDALAAELKRKKFTVYQFDKAKSDIAHRLLSAELKPKDNIVFFDMLVAAPPSALPQLEHGLIEDLAALEQ